MKENPVFSFRALAVLLFVCLSSIAKAAQTAGEDITTVADKGVSGMYLATLCPDHDVAIDKDSAEVFSIYTDCGNPNFLKMRVRSGKYIIKAGDCAVIKTTGAKTIPLEEISGKSSSVFVSDIICPAEDISAADFIIQHSVNEGEYIYMLTNMEENGGFGFTHFTGDIMRKGIFFIVSTVEPEMTNITSPQRSAEENNPNFTFHSSQTFDLQGRKVNNPRTGEVYICNGKKFIQHAEPIFDQPVTVLPIQEGETARTRADKDIEDGDSVPFLPGEAGNDDGF